MEGLSKLQAIMMTLLVIVVVAGATVLSGTTFRDSLTTDSAEFNATNNWVSSITNISANASTYGTLIGVGVMVLGAFAIMKFMEGAAGRNI